MNPSEQFQCDGIGDRFTGENIYEPARCTLFSSMSILNNKAFSTYH